MAITKSINDLPNLQVRANKAGSRRRTVSKNDEIATQMEEANSPFEVAKLAKKYGIKDDEIMERAQSAPNFGQFRMVLGNRMRGAMKRVAAAKNKGVTLSLADAANPKKGRRGAAASKATPKKTASKKTSAKKAPRKKVSKKAGGKKVSKKKVTRKTADSGN